MPNARAGHGPFPCDAGNGRPYRAPFVDAMGLDVAAGDGDVATVRDFDNGGRQELERMLKAGLLQQAHAGKAPRSLL
jgi:hypothetical protein